MRNFLITLIILVGTKAFGQITSTLDKIKTVTTYGYDYDKANEFENSLPKDTFFLPISLPFKKGCKIFYDKDKKRLATEIVFDTTLYRIITKHFNKDGKLIKEQKGWVSPYKKDYKYDPLKPQVRQLEYLKTYQNDSLIYEITGVDGNLLFNYFNPFTKKEFKKRVFYDSGYINCEVVWNYYETRKLKSICNISWEQKVLNTGDEVIETIFDCINFDQNGCIINK